MSGFSGVHPRSDWRAEGPLAAELLRSAARGDRAAYGRLVVMYQDRLYNAVLRMVGDRDEASDLTQEAFMRGLAAVASFRGEAAPYTWLFRIAVNLAITRLRSVQRHRVFSLDAGGNGRDHRGSDQAAELIERARRQSIEQPSHAMEQRERSQLVMAALGRIDPDFRAVLIMRDVEGFDYQQMADVLGLPLGTLKSRLFRARIALRDELMAYMKA